MVTLKYRVCCSMAPIGTPGKPQPEPYSEGIAQVDDVVMMQIKEVC